MDFIKGNEQVKIDPDGIDISGASNIVVKSDGKIGIGTNNPQHPLQVNGSPAIFSNNPEIQLFKQEGPGRLGSTLDWGTTGFTDWKIKAENSGLKIMSGINNNTNESISISNTGTIDISGDVSLNGYLSLNGNIEISGNNKFVVTDTGNVGIGTTTPTEKLDINGNINVYNTETAVIANNGGTLRLGESNQGTQLFGSKVYVGGDTIDSKDVLYFMKGQSNHADLEIGAGEPANLVACMRCSQNLHIDSATGHSIYLNHYNTSGSTYVRNYIASSSDERIKKNIELVNDEEALNKILALETKKFNYINFETTEKQIGFIAQDVEKIIPDAVCRTEGFGAELMLECDFTYVDCCPDEENRREYYILTINTDILEDGIKYRVKHNGQERDLIASVIDGVTTMKLQDKWEFDDILKMLIVGKCVDDFLRVKHDMIYCLHHSAIQELSRRNDQKTEKIKDLEHKVDSLTARLEALESSVLSLQNN